MGRARRSGNRFFSAKNETAQCRASRRSKEKDSHYLLSTDHRDGQHKAAFFRSFGFKLESWETLADTLLNHARVNEVTEVVPTLFGQNFVVEGRLPAPDGRKPRVRAVWFIANRQEIATLATAYPLDE